MLPDEPVTDQLSERQQVTLILRMLMDGHSQLVHGELVEVSGQSRGHFTNWEGLLSVLNDWQLNLTTRD